jgi:hypothetical protein
MPVNWTEEKKQFIIKHKALKSTALCALFFETFGERISPANVRNWKSKLNVSVGKVRWKKKWIKYIADNAGTKTLKQISIELELDYTIVGNITQYYNISGIKYKLYDKKTVQYIAENAGEYPERVAAELGLSKVQLQSCINHYGLDIDLYDDGALSETVRARLRVYDAVSERDCMNWIGKKSRLHFVLDPDVDNNLAKHGEEMIFGMENMKIREIE